MDGENTSPTKQKRKQSTEQIHPQRPIEMIHRDPINICTLVVLTCAYPMRLVIVSMNLLGFCWWISHIEGNAHWSSPNQIIKNSLFLTSSCMRCQAVYNHLNHSNNTEKKNINSLIFFHFRFVFSTYTHFLAGVFFL